MELKDMLPEKPLTDPVELLRKTADIIEEFPEYHDQQNWCGWDDDAEGTSLDSLRSTGDCGTTFCAAGWICNLGGAVWKQGYTEMAEWGGSYGVGDTALTLLGANILDPSKERYRAMDRIFYETEDDEHETARKLRNVADAIESGAL